MPHGLIEWRDAHLPGGLHALIRQAVVEGHGWVSQLPSEWEKRSFTEKGEGLFLVMGEAVTTAMAAVVVDQRVDDGRTARLKFVYVTAALRTQGIGRQLLDACTARARQGWSVLTLHTDNPAAASLYERYGFRRCHDRAHTTHRLELGNFSRDS